MSMIRINIDEARTLLSKSLKRLRGGETIVLCKRNTPVAEIRPLPVRPGKRRPIGLAAGKVRVTKRFFEPLPEDVIASFRGGGGWGSSSDPAPSFWVRAGGGGGP